VLRRLAQNDFATEAQIDVARRRQELWMRWILLLTVVASVLLSSLSTLVYGPPTLPFAMVQGTWATLLAWLVRRLFSN
jgi:hypothetical protein